MTEAFHCKPIKNSKSGILKRKSLSKILEGNFDNSKF
jgi:hypothetical protein